MDTEVPRLPSPHKSATLERLRQLESSGVLQAKASACGDCPISVWHWHGEDMLECFCTALHDVTWDGKKHAVQLCDARDAEIKLLPKPATV